MVSCLTTLFNRTKSPPASFKVDEEQNPFDDPEVVVFEKKDTISITTTTALRQSNSKKLIDLRTVLSEEGLDAYVIPTADAHASEYVGECDARRSWISGFTGSAGVGIVTTTRAFMFVDSRYYTQAEQELNLKDWTLFKVGMKGVLNWEKWLSTMSPGSKIGLDPYLVTYTSILNLKSSLDPLKIEMKFPNRNLVDAIWSDRPLRSHEKVVIHEMRFAGESSLSKLSTLKSYLNAFSPSSISSPSFLISSLPTIAYILNLRGSDIKFNPLFYSYLLVHPSTTKESILFIQDNVFLSQEAKEQLKESGIKIESYEKVEEVLKIELGGGDNYLKKTKKVLSGSTISFALTSIIGVENLTIIRSPIEDSQSIKNSIELQGFRNAYLRDAIAWIKWSAWLEELIRVQNGKINEFDAGVELTRFRKQGGGEFYRGLSYENISATGENAALPHYAPPATNSTIINTTTPYLNDSGAQYLDGTIDTTRTVHFGKPTSLQKLAFTRVLQGHISIDTIVFPEGITGFQLDLLARKALWSDGMDYSHGTGHGVGEFLSVHEGPQGIGPSLIYNSTPLEVGHITSNEPGYYKVGSFGIRLESVLAVKKIKTSTGGGGGKEVEGEKEWRGFERMTLVPIQKSLVEMKLLSKEEKLWLKEHNLRCWEKVGPLLGNDQRARKWLKRQ